MCRWFTGKTIKNKIELSDINRFEPTSHEKDRMPISNRLRPRGIIERDHCASGWSYICDHSTNPVKTYSSNTTISQWGRGKTNNLLSGPALGQGGE